MQIQEQKIWRAVLATVVITGGIVFYFTRSQNFESATPKQQNTVFTQTSKEYAAIGKQLWSAFSCSTWASHSGDQKEAERLFLFGYEQGKKFLGAARAGKITDEDFRKEVPIGISMSLAGPSDDFILGVISTNVKENALEEVFYTNYDRSKLNSNDLQKSIAGNKFRDGNCQLIGK